MNNDFFEMPGKIDMQHSFPLQMQMLSIKGNGKENQMVSVSAPSSGTGDSLYLVNTQSQTLNLVDFTATNANFTVVKDPFNMATVERVPMIDSRIFFLDSVLRDLWSVDMTGGDLTSEYFATNGMYPLSNSEIPLLILKDVLTFGYKPSTSVSSPVFLMVGQFQ